MIECKVCNAKFDIGADSKVQVSHKKEFKVNGQSIFLTYYDCPSCGKRYFVQIDDSNSLRELWKVKKQFTELAIARREDKEILKKQSEKFKKARQHLSDYRTKLMKEYTGKCAIDEAGKIYVLRFNV